MFVSRASSGGSERLWSRAVIVGVAAVTVAGCDQLGLSTTPFDPLQGDVGVYKIIIAGFKDGTPQSGLNLGSGTGFLVNDKNLMATNRHVVINRVTGRPHEEIRVVLVGRSGIELVQAQVVAPQPTSGQYEDLAFLQPLRTLPGRPARLADYAPIISTSVRAVGFPGAVDQAMMSRAYSGVARDASVTTLRSLTDRLGSELSKEWQSNPRQFSATQNQGSVARFAPQENVPVINHQAPINPGNSGGPLFDTCGNVVGVNTAIPLVGGTQWAQGVNISLGSQWVVERAKAGGHIIPTSSRCVSASLQQLTGVEMNTNLALMVVMFLTTLTVVFFARNTPAVQRGMTILTRSNVKPRGLGAVGATVLDAAPRTSGGAVARTVVDMGAGRGAVGDVRLIPVGGGTPISIRSDRLEKGMVVGREPAGDVIVIDEKTVSKRHARLTLDRGRVSVEDLGSANGTWKGRDRVSRETFGAGDVVKFGSAEYRVELPGGGGQPIAATVVEAPRPADRAPEQAISLSGMDSDGKPVKFTLRASSERVWLLGRKAGVADHVIPDQSVSSEHARIRFRPGHGFEVCDAKSRNGTKLDGEALTTSYVPIGKARTIKMGEFELTINQA